MTNVAIVGSRTYPDLDLVREYVAELPEGTVVISGGARGVDSVAEQAARKRGLETLVVYPDWKTYGKSAGMRRNITIVDSADLIVAFWNRESKGTKHTIAYAEKKLKPVIVVPPRIRP